MRFVILAVCLVGSGVTLGPAAAQDSETMTLRGLPGVWVVVEGPGPRFIKAWLSVNPKK